MYVDRSRSARRSHRTVREPVHPRPALAREQDSGATDPESDLRRRRGLRLRMLGVAIHRRRSQPRPRPIQHRRRTASTMLQRQCGGWLRRLRDSVDSGMRLVPAIGDTSSPSRRRILGFRTSSSTVSSRQPRRSWQPGALLPGRGPPNSSTVTVVHNIRWARPGFESVESTSRAHPHPATPSSGTTRRRHRTRGPAPWHLRRSTVVIENSLIEGCGGSGADWNSELGHDLGGNLDLDPRFVDFPPVRALLDSEREHRRPSKQSNVFADPSGGPSISMERPASSVDEVDMGSYEFQGQPCATFDLVTAPSWDGISLQQILDTEYGPGTLDVTTDYEGAQCGDAQTPYWLDDAVDGWIIREVADFAPSTTSSAGTPKPSAARPHRRRRRRRHLRRLRQRGRNRLRRPGRPHPLRPLPRPERQPATAPTPPSPRSSSPTAPTTTRAPTARARSTPPTAATRRR